MSSFARHQSLLAKWSSRHKMKVSGKLWATTALSHPPGKRRRSAPTEQEECVLHRAGMDALEQRKPLCSCRQSNHDSSVFQPVA
jgi:hypothetical protein